MVSGSTTKRSCRETLGSFPQAPLSRALAEDYARMLSSGMLLDEDEPFGTVIHRCALISEKANAAGAAGR